MGMTTPFALTGISVVTGDEAGTVHMEWTVVVDRHGAIESAGPASEVQVASDVLSINGAGKYVIPG